MWKSENRHKIPLHPQLQQYMFCFPVFDSDAQTPPGIFSGQVDWFGYRDQCVRVKATDEQIYISPGFYLPHDYDAKYCRTFYTADKVGVTNAMWIDSILKLQILGGYSSKPL